ncbi:hypothetical protein D3C72_1381590 [compost metagenome]
MPPAMSADRVEKWNCVSGVALSCGNARQNIAPWLMPIASGPLRISSHSSPMRALPVSERSWSLVVIGFATS